MEMKYVRLHEWMLSVLLSTASFVVPFSARAGFATSGSLGGVGSRLKEGTVYTVFEDKTITRGSIYSATYVDDNATTVIYIHKGVTLTIQGGGAGGGDLMSGGSTSVATLTSFDGIGTADNPDGTVTVTVPLAVAGDKRFFKIVTE